MRDESGLTPQAPQPAASSSPSFSTPLADVNEGARRRSYATRTCKTCGGVVSAHASVCPACGETIKERKGLIRCRYCGERTAAELTLCPYCGRELASAPPRVLTWGAPIALVALFLVLVIRQTGGGNPLAWAQDRLSVEGFPSRETASRGLVVVMTPAPGDIQTSSEAAPTPYMLDLEVLATAITQSANGAIAGSLDSPEITVVDADVMRTSQVQNVNAVDVVPTPEAQKTVVQSDQAAVDATVSATPEATSAASGEPASAAAQPQPSASDNSQQADKPSESVRDAVSGAEDEPETREAEAVESQERGLLVSASSAGEASPAVLPTSTPTSATTPTLAETSTPTLTPTVTPTATYAPMPAYEVRRGDTLVVIARKHDVTVEKLMLVNNISAAEAFTMQPGQELRIPVKGSIGALDPTSTPTATLEPTPFVPPTDTPMPTPTAPAVRLDAPLLRSPEPGTPISCSSPSSLTWLPVPFMRSTDVFLLHLGFVGGRTEDGRDVVVWVLEQPRPSSVTSWDMDGALCSVAPHEFSGKWHWYVEVAESVEGGYLPVSPPSETWHFTWN